MSIAIATMGLFKGCCIVGGAVPTYRDEVEPTCNVHIKRVYFEDIINEVIDRIIIIKGVNIE